MDSITETDPGRIFLVGLPEIVSVNLTVIGSVGSLTEKYISIDDTNGNESYGGGRYINFDIPQVDNLIIDFNSAFNPYCVYDEKYSCPIVPRENYLSLEINAGIKN